VPRGEFAAALEARVSGLTRTLFLPLFFVFSGLNTRVGLIDSAFLVGVSALVLLAASAGKALGCAAAARACGESARDALSIGALMNARGLVELIALNVGLQRGLITPTLFTVMVVMAVGTTLSASPAFGWTRRLGRPVAATRGVGGADA
jgi:Kef-type K+ transport system membrane component KefB